MINSIHFSIKVPYQATSKQQHRKGALLLELIISIGILTVLLVVISKMGVAQNKQRKYIEQQAAATHHLQNLMEVYLAQDWDSISPTVPHQLDLPQSAREFLPGYKISVSVVTEDNFSLEKKIQIQLSWKNLNGVSINRRSLTSWIYQTREDPK